MLGLARGTCSRTALADAEHRADLFLVGAAS
jgi:hypothetical protein